MRFRPMPVGVAVACAPRLRLFADFQGCRQAQILGGRAYVDFVFAGQLGEAVLLCVEDGETQRVKRERNGFGFARS